MMYVNASTRRNVKALAYSGGYIVLLKISPTTEGKTFGIQLIRVIYIRRHRFHRFHRSYIKISSRADFDSRWTAARFDASLNNDNILEDATPRIVSSFTVIKTKSFVTQDPSQSDAKQRRSVDRILIII